MKICVQAIPSDFWFIKVMVRTFGYFLNLFIRCHISHNGKDLSGQHHTYVILMKTFNSISVIIIVAVKPSFVR